jgi:hypothetical protein
MQPRFPVSISVRTAFLLTAVGFTSGGCSAMHQVEKEGTKPVPFETALHQLEVDLGRVHIIVPSSLLAVDWAHWEKAKEVADIDNILADSQCYDIDAKTGKADPALRNRNPLIPVSTGPLQLTVQGQLSEAGTFTISITPSAGGTITRQTQQQVMMPLTLVSLTTVPEFYVGQQMTNIQYVTLVTAFKSTDAKKADIEYKQIADYVASILEVASRLSAVTERALKQFDTDPNTRCKGRDNAGGGLVGPATPPSP